MGKIKDCLDHIFTGPEAPPLTQAEVYELQLQSLRHEINRISEMIEQILYKQQYYNEPLLREHFTRIDHELKRVSRDLT